MVSLLAFIVGTGCLVFGVAGFITSVSEYLDAKSSRADGVLSDDDRIRTHHHRIG